MPHKPAPKGNSSALRPAVRKSRPKKVVQSSSEGKDETEKALEAFLFADAPEFAVDLPDVPEANEDGFFEDKGEKKKEDEAAWKDDDDEKVVVDIAGTSRLRKLRTSHREARVTGAEYSLRLRAQFQALSQNTEWANLKKKRTRESGSDSEEGPLDEVLKTVQPLVGTSALLPSQMLSVTRVRDANVQEPSAAVVQSVGWHPNGKLLLTAALDKTVRLFEVDGEVNPKVQGVFFNDMPIWQAAFSPDGSEIIASGRRKYFYIYDLHQGTPMKIPGIRGREEKSLESFIISPDGSITFFGKDGNLILVDPRSKNWIANMKMNGSLRAADYTRDGLELFSFGGEGEVYLWDVRTRRCHHKFFDDGCIHGMSLSASKNSEGPQYLATGAESGVVNLYDRSTLVGSDRPAPLKALMNITVPVDCMTFNHDAQLFAWSSRTNTQCLRVLHVASQTVFTNWPTSVTPLGHVSCLAFSPNSGYLAMGNHKGRVLLYRMNHFGVV